LSASFNDDSGLSTEQPVMDSKTFPLPELQIHDKKCPTQPHCKCRIESMQTNVVIDDTLMERALTLSGLQSQREAIEEGLRLLVRLKEQERLRTVRGKLRWEGDLGAMRRDRPC
jgi:Arc/MetJ family transcription regulator